MKRGTPEYEAHWVKARAKAISDLAEALTRFSPEELRWDLGCNLSTEARELVLAEMVRRGRYDA